MSYIPGINQAATASSTNSTSSTGSLGSAIMGKQDFLTLLVAQLQNQDPLNPDDPTEFTAQLAQFSSLEQLFTLNEGMADLAAAQSSSERLSALSLIGKEVTYYGSSFSYNGQPVELGYQLDGSASDVKLIIQSSGGATVKVLDPSELGPGNHFLTWDGTDQNGNPVSPGNYKIVLQASSGSEDSTVGAAPLLRSEVTGVDLSESESSTLQTQAGTVSLASVLGVYDQYASTDPSLDGSGSATAQAAATAAAAEAASTVSGALTEEAQPASTN